jgi:hypothetical protein
VEAGVQINDNIPLMLWIEGLGNRYSGGTDLHRIPRRNRVGSRRATQVYEVRPVR